MAKQALTSFMSTSQRDTSGILDAELSRIFSPSNRIFGIARSRASATTLGDARRADAANPGETPRRHVWPSWAWAATWLAQSAPFSGPVAYLDDPDSLCVAMGKGPASWVEVRLADFYGPESQGPGGGAAKAALQRVTLGHTVACRADYQICNRIAVTTVWAGGASAS